jgi:COMPASS component SWD3
VGRCVDFVGEEGTLLVSGSSDNMLRVWDVEDGQCVRVLGDGDLGSGGGHTSRIWDVTSSSSGDVVASASGDSTVKFWNLRGTTKSACSATLSGHEGDVYSVKFHQSNVHSLPCFLVLDACI